MLEQKKIAKISVQRLYECVCADTITACIRALAPAPYSQLFYVSKPLNSLSFFHFFHIVFLPTIYSLVSFSSSFLFAQFLVFTLKWIASQVLFQYKCHFSFTSTLAMAMHKKRNSSLRLRWYVFCSKITPIGVA